MAKRKAKKRISTLTIAMLVVALVGAILCGILALVFTFLAADAFIGFDGGDLASVETTLSFGAYLLAAGSVVGGVGALVGSKKRQTAQGKKGAARRSSFFGSGELYFQVQHFDKKEFIQKLPYNVVCSK